jgi:hypothetical protein
MQNESRVVHYFPGPWDLRNGGMTKLGEQPFTALVAFVASPTADKGETVNVVVFDHHGAAWPRIGIPFGAGEDVTPRAEWPKAPGPDDGPTIAEWMAAGYKASNYPPAGFNPKSSPEEIEAAIEAELAAEEAAKLKAKKGGD